MSNGNRQLLSLLMVSFIVMHSTDIDFELLTEDLSNAPWHVGELFTEIDDSIQLSPEEEVNSGVDIPRREASTDISNAVHRP